LIEGLGSTLWHDPVFEDEKSLDFATTGTASKRPLRICLPDPAAATD